MTSLLCALATVAFLASSCAATKPTQRHVSCHWGSAKLQLTPHGVSMRVHCDDKKDAYVFRWRTFFGIKFPMGSSGKQH